ncbi:hypothetical protein BD309DRAFT_964525 [Dichomitus squalens]|uniref:Uncharacterized protein n=1 Tax=Dichomitus squalens TaxID=114155 RepID=A0A4Q9Q134_9APHY|nr:hypothetical protein BD309DRAFT_964525 [Dichomitus squalens]TBU60872.1 hypothetical protein BD310DRAFT_922254 [Dichomitus squalens]
MAQHQRGVCSLYGTPRGCRFGNRCKFSHDLSGSISPRGPSSGPSSPSRSRSQTPAAQTPGRSPSGRGRGGPGLQGVPRNVCQYFWTSGACDRSFECSFRHVRGNGATDAQATAAHQDEDEDGVVDFFSPEGLAASAGSVREDRWHNLNPSEVHNHLKEFVRPGYQFDSAAQVQGFVRLLASVNDRNKAWTTGSAQEFLEFVVGGNLLVRLGDALRFEPVSATYHYGVLSFQRGYFPIFQFFSSDLVLKSTLHKNINLLFAVLKNNHEVVFTTLRTCLFSMIQNRSWKDPSPSLHDENILDGVAVFRTLATVFLQYFNRYKDAIRSNSDIPDFISQFSEWFDTWADGVSISPPRFEDPIASAPLNNRRLTVGHIQEDIDRLIAIVERETGTVLRLRKGPPKSTVTAAQRSQARIAQLAQTYDPPGVLRPGGPRHDNDFLDIEEIRIAPTHDELFCPVQPYLPVFSRDAPHHLPADSMERHLDIQFRLLREELISATRASLAALHDDLLKIWAGNRAKKDKTQLETLIAKNGGSYRTTGRDSVFFQLYTNVEFVGRPPEATRKGVSVGLVLDAPPNGAARDKDSKKRVAYWEHSRRLQGASLVALVAVANRSFRVYLGVVSSYGKDISESAKHEQGRIQVRVSFFDPDVELMALRRDRLCTSKSNFAVLVDNSVMFESVRPFLDKLQTIEPTEIPFSRYIASGGPLTDVQVLPPKYAQAPGFKFKLQSLAQPRRSISDLDVSNPLAVRRARDELKRLSILDPSQAEALVDTLTREVSLIQGPPGTGKSFTAKEILRVLFASKIRPIVLIAYTNHALDHMVTSVLDAEITQKIVRLGTRSADERIAEYTLDKLEKLASEATLNRSMKRQYAKMKELEERLTKTMNSILLPLLTWEKIEQHLDIHYPDHADSLRIPPFWIAEFASQKWAEEDQEGEFQEVTRKGNKKKTVDKTVARTLYGVWRSGSDVHFLQQQPAAPPTSKKGKQVTDLSIQAQSLLANPSAFFDSLGFAGLIPPIPGKNRPLDELLRDPRLWQMSLLERARLADEWEKKIRWLAYTSQQDHYKSLKEEYREACKEHDDMRDEVRRRLLSQTDLIACTTTGAATLTSLLSSIQPKVLMVEEAGQVLEAHILTSLVTSVRHLICIGDPQQLRPTMATFTLSMDSGIGNELYKFDRSLMERLSDVGYPMSQINVQRRMRPTISHFIREILYPKLEDNEIVTRYPPVQGMQKDVYFLNHLNKENGTEDSVSKFNTYEVDMIKDLVLYFLRQGAYSGPGDIAVLCAYLGQLQKVRAALRDLKIAVSVDERDADQLARQGLDEDVEFQEVVVAKHIRLGTVDIFQGQEAKIVIVSLVRNSGQIDTESASIGFLKSANRINVALSRAKHGLFVLGNAANLRKNQIWSTILDEMESRDQIGPAFPIVCPRHPEQVQLVSKPGQLPLYAPAGGCVLPCNARLACGHICPSACHAVLDNHRSVRCMEPCNRTPCPRQHPCSRRCSDDCGRCEFPMYSVTLPCGHTASKVPCHKLQDLYSVQCTKQVLKKLPGCEHSAIVACHEDPANAWCSEPCGGKLQCCSRTCKASCSDCRSLTVQRTQPAVGKMSRTYHIGHPCERLLYCQHQCGLDCAREHQCNTKCSQTCRQQCVHHKCAKPCSEPCAPCMEPCQWSCPHFTCPVLCGSICSRLPCDEPCMNLLKCGHLCPSVCGEPCTSQKCVVCLSADGRADIVDFIMQRRLEDVDLSSTDISDRLITLACGHIFTVETLDGHCGMHDYYDIDQMGQFLSTKSPPVNYQTPPTCPTCRGPITALRYGRITKRATLDILEQNVASTMSSALDECSPLISEYANNISDYQQQAKKLATEAGNEDESTKRKEISFTENGPLPASAFDLQAMQEVHGIPQEEARAWYQVVKTLVNTYRRVAKVAATRGAHVKAYEAALSTLFRLEMQAIAEDPARATDTPEPMALVIVDRKIGQPPPKADVRFQIEAYFLSLELRSLMAEIARSRIEGLSVTSNDPDVTQHRELWTLFVSFLYDSCIADADKAINIAKNSSASRQAARATVHKLRFAFEAFRWTILCERSALFRAGALDKAERERLCRKVTNYKRLLPQISNLIEQTYIRSRPSQTTADLKKERQWMNENCRTKVEAWERECTKLEEFVENGGFYQPMSTQEREEIVKAFGFSHRGHFYNCENGHTFVITECGGAMEESKCPECNAPIGGSSHRLTTSNTRATEFEAIARRQGSLNGVFDWTRDA